MPINVRIDDDVAILSNIARLMNDPRHFDAGRDVRDLLDQGFRQFVIELAGIREAGTSLLGLLMTLTRAIRQAGGEVVLARPSRGLEQFLSDWGKVFQETPAAR